MSEFQRARTSRIGTDWNQEGESRMGLLNRCTLPPGRCGQAWLHQRQFILHVHLGLVDVRAGLEGYGDRRRTIGVAGRRHITQAFYAIQLLLDYLSDILLQRRSFGPGICRADREGGRRTRWLLINRTGMKGDRTSGV